MRDASALNVNDVVVSKVSDGHELLVVTDQVLALVILRETAGNID